MVMNPKLFKERQKEQTLREHMSIVEQVAHRIKRRVPEHIDLEELRSVGYVGLMEAIERYDDDKKVPFRVYAEIRVNGAMLDFLRKEDWMPRGLRQQVKELQQAEYMLTCTGKERSDHNVAEILHASIDEVRMIRSESQHRTIIQGTVLVGDTEVQFVEECVADEHQNIEADLISEEGEQLIRLSLEQLPEKEHYVLVQYFFEDQNLKQIGLSLGVTESRACQLRKSALSRLQKLVQQKAS
jgi:RNA polymerase sigma factor for flagellar operon FliA